jgi:glycosyltransferase involved in cell wall biosynthesis
MNYQATILISTKNRKNELRQALSSCYRQTVSVEVIVIDDGSTDATSEMVKREFPQARLFRSEESKGLICQRNYGTQLAECEIVFSIDDDAEFQSVRTVEQTLAEFYDPRIGAVAIPYVDVLYGDKVRQQAPQPDKIYVTSSFRGTAYAVRRQIFTNLAGYREFYFHQGEEEDFCIRMLNQNQFVKLGIADPIHHYESPKRDTYRMDVYGPRNLILFSWYNTPLVYLLPHTIVTSVKAWLYGVSIGRSGRKLFGLVQGYRACFAQRRYRHPVASKTYRIFRHLKRNSYQLLENII